MPENKKPQTGKAFLKTHTTEEIADLISSGHPPFQEEVHCDTTSCRDCWSLARRWKNGWQRNVTAKERYGLPRSTFSNGIWLTIRA